MAEQPLRISSSCSCAGKPRSYTFFDAPRAQKRCFSCSSKRDYFIQNERIVSFNGHRSSFTHIPPKLFPEEREAADKTHAFAARILALRYELIWLSPSEHAGESVAVYSHPSCYSELGSESARRRSFRRPEFRVAPRKPKVANASHVHSDADFRQMVSSEKLTCYQEYVCDVLQQLGNSRGPSRMSLGL